MRDFANKKILGTSAVIYGATIIGALVIIGAK